MSCTHRSTRTLSCQHAHRWCRRCGALYCYVAPLGWMWLTPQAPVGAAAHDELRAFINGTEEDTE